ncbi:MAG: DUF1624 domain-containing protein [Lachnospiraceae bacterium]|nr:DUF1624 domain-containing protein [Lachnospiraceae bacterium]
MDDNVENKINGSSKQRYGLLDSFRGLVLISMIVYHGSWDLVYLFYKNWTWYQGTGAYIWQQSICWSFILLSGFCWSLGHKPLKRGLLVFGAGAVVSAVTLIFMPQERVIFGVLTMTGSSMLFMIPLSKLSSKVSPGLGLLFSLFLFLVTRNVNSGFLGFEGWNIARLPQMLYSSYFTTFLGFPVQGFFSTDYFSFIPWFFLFLSGYFIYRMMERSGGFRNGCLIRKWEPLAFLGRHSLLIYMLHQPLVFGILTVMNAMGLF